MKQLPAIAAIVLGLIALWFRDPIIMYAVLALFWGNARLYDVRESHSPRSED